MWPPCSIGLNARGEWRRAAEAAGLPLVCFPLTQLQETTLCPTIKYFSTYFLRSSVCFCLDVLGPPYLNTGCAWPQAFMSGGRRMFFQLIRISLCQNSFIADKLMQGR